jgi:hypothetical protein
MVDVKVVAYPNFGNFFLKNKSPSIGYLIYYRQNVEF